MGLKSMKKIENLGLGYLRIWKSYSFGKEITMTICLSLIVRAFSGHRRCMHCSGATEKLLVNAGFGCLYRFLCIFCS
ncbi:hypothetical protein X798_05096 [Onchocerca flexuosa]|uniref:Uncharacterized protein n=2 Tax=Onchocerca flexuosa TaxID=387005 RepID=A0A183HIT3_9BILA|nr:hypothetical protein X798_05096 [Onchocerca flexuosa]VDO50804.1 unnamed protein product [Onchocerca flexuosa]